MVRNSPRLLPTTLDSLLSLDMPPRLRPNGKAAERVPCCANFQKQSFLDMTRLGRLRFPARLPHRSVLQPLNRRAHEKWTEEGRGRLFDALEQSFRVNSASGDRRD